MDKAWALIPEAGRAGAPLVAFAEVFVPRFLTLAWTALTVSPHQV